VITNDVAIPGVAYARAEWGRWIADCPAPYCRSALNLALHQTIYRCWECETVAEVVWPTYAQDIERILMMRPDPTTRNWFPGESLHDLVWENAVHGILPGTPEELEANPGVVLSVVGDRIEQDVLALDAARRAIEGSK
jgi:hypothetical protein